MTFDRCSRAFLRLSCAALFVMGSGGTALAASDAEDSGSATASATGQQAQRSPDFLFGPPRGSFGLRSGWVFARAESDIFSFYHDLLTLDRQDFNAPALAIDLGFAVAPHLDVVFGFDLSRSTTASEYRRLVDNNRQPITQDTRLQQLNFGGSVKFALLPRGREISQYAWIPRSVAPYVGAGGGALWYQFHQDGDFVRISDSRIVSDVLNSSGWTPSAHVFGGVDVKVWRRLYVTADGRYLWAHATLGRDFSGFEPIDLAGFKMTGGINWIF